MIVTPQPEGSDIPPITRIYTIWPATQEDLPAASSGPWHQERRWLVLDVTDGIAAAYIVEGPVAHPEALHRATEMQNVARMQLKDSRAGTGTSQAVERGTETRNSPELHLALNSSTGVEKYPTFQVS